jgi:hypothetical protein
VLFRSYTIYSVTPTSFLQGISLPTNCANVQTALLHVTDRTGFRCGYQCDLLSPYNFVKPKAYASGVHSLQLCLCFAE